MSKTIQPETLYKWIAKGSSFSSNKFAIVDVRDYDYEGGRIIGSWHYPAETFRGKVSEIIERCHKDNCKEVVFHCSFSQQRGPSCAAYFEGHLDSNADLSVYVLKGGFRSWSRLYGDDNSVTESI